MLPNREPALLWQPSASFQAQSHLAHYMRWLAENRHLHFSDYQSLWQWSVDDVDAFWESLWEYFKIITHSPFSAVRTNDAMPNVRWFEGSTLNYAEHIFRNATDANPAIIFKRENAKETYISWRELQQKVSAVQQYLLEAGVKKGDRVAAFLPNIPEATIAFLASISIGAIWSSCSPDFGVSSVVDRFQQIEPKILFAADGYFYNGKTFDRLPEIVALQTQLPTIQKVVVIPYIHEFFEEKTISNSISWDKIISTKKEQALIFEAVSFNHPIWILYSSGTTGMPKAITHSQGGVLLEHLKYMSFHNDCHAGERFFWYTTTGWMMWNFVQAALLVGATIVLYDGSPNYPSLHSLWEFAENIDIQHFGTSAPFLIACMKEGISPKNSYALKGLRSLGSTGSPLPPEAFAWIYENIKTDLWLCSMSGGTDVCSAFVGGCPLLPVYLGEIQCRALGCSLFSYDEMGNVLDHEMGEMVITKPMPSMPIFFWNDADKQKYLSSYFEMFPHIWRHGDWICITPRQGLVIYGRSDATLNRMGIRIGSSEIYRAVDKVQSIKDSLIVNLELSGGRHFMPLFVVMQAGIVLDENIKREIANILRSDYSPRHIPDAIVEVQEIPYTISGKKMETPVKRILMGMETHKAANLDSMRNPKSLEFFKEYAKEIV